MQTLSQGNSYTLTVAIRNADNSIKSLVGTSELKYQLAERKHKAPIIAFDLSSPELQITDPAGGQIAVTLTSDNLNKLREGAHYHELWHVNALGQATTLMAEKLDISSKLIKE